MIERLYASAWHHPGVAWVSALGLLLTWSRWPRALRPYLLAATTTTVLDAWFTGALAPAFAKPAATFLSVVFVIIGDARWFYLMERGRLLLATVLACVVPAVQLGLLAAFPSVFSDSRVTFLVYEAVFVLFAVTLGQTRYKGIGPHLTAFVVIQYVLWATADVLILTGHAWALALRLVPNVLYYGGFLWFVAYSRSSSSPILAPSPSATKASR